MNQQRINEIADELRTAIATDNDAPRLIRETLMPLMLTDPLREIVAELSDIAEQVDILEGSHEVTVSLLAQIRRLRNLSTIA